MINYDDPQSWIEMATPEGIAFSLVYMAAWFIHLAAAYFATKGWVIGQHLFAQSSPFHIFHCVIEQKFWTICVGNLANVCFLIVIPFYIINEHGSSTGWKEPIFLVFHVTSSVTTLIWHYFAVNEIKQEVEKRKNENPRR